MEERNGRTESSLNVKESSKACQHKTMEEKRVHGSAERRESSHTSMSSAGKSSCVKCWKGFSLWTVGSVLRSGRSYPFCVKSLVVSSEKPMRR